VMTKRFGKKRVAFDPSDPEANKLAVSKGFTVIPGRGLSKGQWKNVKRTGVVKPAGQVTPSPKPYSENGEPMEYIAEDDYTPQMEAFSEYAANLIRHILKVPPLVNFVKEPKWPFRGTYGSGHLVVNISATGMRGNIGRFPSSMPALDAFLIHELAHHYCSDHLSSRYYAACCEVGADLAELNRTNPEIFEIVVGSKSTTTAGVRRSPS